MQHIEIGVLIDKSNDALRKVELAEMEIRALEEKESVLAAKVDHVSMLQDAVLEAQVAAGMLVHLLGVQTQLHCKPDLFSYEEEIAVEVVKQDLEYASKLEGLLTQVQHIELQ